MLLRLLSESFFIYNELPLNSNITHPIKLNARQLLIQYPPISVWFDFKILNLECQDLSIIILLQYNIKLCRNHFIKSIYS